MRCNKVNIAVSVFWNMVLYY